MDTTVSALKVGTQLVMGRYGVDKDSPHPIVWLKGNPNCDFITEKAIDYLCFDAAEEAGHYRYVNNAKYPVSNLFSFLNSDQMMWYHAMHDNDASPVLLQDIAMLATKTTMGSCITSKTTRLLLWSEKNMWSEKVKCHR